MRIPTYHLAALTGSALTLTLIAAACGSEARATPADTEAAIPVRAAAVTTEGSAAITATGTLGSKDEIPLAFKIGGVVSRVTVDEGARVHAGQPIAALDLREIDAAVAKATAGAEKTRRDATRLERLHRDSVATLSQWQDAETARDAAEADLRGARVNREYAVIVAPAAGIILKRNVNPGAQLTAGTAVVMFGSATRGSVLRVGLADRDAVRVREHDAATVTFDALGTREFKGTVRQVGAAADPRTGTFVVEIALDGTEALPRGLVGRAVIAARGVRAPQEASRTGVVAIPAQALIEGEGDQGVVYALDPTGRRAVRHQVTLLGMEGDRVLVRGLDGVPQVLTAGAAWLHDGARVEVKP